MPLVFPITGRPAKIVRRTPRSAAGPLAGLPVVDETDPVGEERVQRGNLLLWHLLERWLCPREVTFCSGICSSGGFAPGGPADRGSAPQFLRILRTGKTSGVRAPSRPPSHHCLQATRLQRQTDYKSGPRR